MKNTIPAHLLLCSGLGMRICESCARNVDLQPEGTIYSQTIRPAADPPKCMDWRAVPARAADASHGRQ